MAPDEESGGSQNSGELHPDLKKFFAWVAGIGGLISIAVGLHNLGVDLPGVPAHPTTTAAGSGSPSSGKPHFVETGLSRASCRRGYGCDLSGIFVNQGDLGNATVTFLVHTGGGSPETCMTTIPTTAKGSSATAGCHVESSELEEAMRLIDVSGLAFAHIANP